MKSWLDFYKTLREIDQKEKKANTWGLSKDCYRSYVVQRLQSEMPPGLGMTPKAREVSQVSEKQWVVSQRGMSRPIQRGSWVSVPGHLCHAHGPEDATLCKFSRKGRHSDFSVRPPNFEMLGQMKYICGLILSNLWCRHLTWMDVEISLSWLQNKQMSLARPCCQWFH